VHGVANVFLFTVNKQLVSVEFSSAN